MGYAEEAARAVLNNVAEARAVHTVLAVSKSDNLRSMALLVKLGFRFQDKIPLYGLSNNLYQYLAQQNAATKV